MFTSFFPQPKLFFLSVVLWSAVATALWYGGADGWGALIGLIFMSPLLGMAVGASAGAVSGALTDVGINDDFMKNLAASFKNGTSVLFVLVRKATPDKVLAELQGTGGKVIKTSLTHEEEDQLQAVLSTAKASPAG